MNNTNATCLGLKLDTQGELYITIIFIIIYTKYCLHVFVQAVLDSGAPGV